MSGSTPFSASHSSLVPMQGTVSVTHQRATLLQPVLSQGIKELMARNLIHLETVVLLTPGFFILEQTQTQTLRRLRNII